MRETVTVRIRLDEPSLIPVLLASLFHLCCLMIMFISLKFCISLWGVVGWSIACHLCHVIEGFRTNTFLLSNHCKFCHLRTSKLLFLCLRISKTINLGEFRTKLGYDRSIVEVHTPDQINFSFLSLPSPTRPPLLLITIATSSSSPSPIPMFILLYRLPPYFFPSHSPPVNHLLPYEKWCCIVSQPKQTQWHTMRLKVLRSKYRPSRSKSLDTSNPNWRHRDSIHRSCLNNDGFGIVSWHCWGHLWCC